MVEENAVNLSPAATTPPPRPEKKISVGNGPPASPSWMTQQRPPPPPAQESAAPSFSSKFSKKLSIGKFKDSDSNSSEAAAPPPPPRNTVGYSLVFTACNHPLLPFAVSGYNVWFRYKAQMIKSFHVVTNVLNFLSRKWRLRLATLITKVDPRV